MAATVNSLPEQGQLVSVRSRKWVVDEVVPSTLPMEGLPSLNGGQTLLTLSSIEDDGLAVGCPVQPRSELEPTEPGAHVPLA